MTEPAFVETRALTKYFYPSPGLFRSVGKTYVRALEEVDLAIYPGEFLGVVGEAGSGKTILGRLLINLLPPTSGQVFFAGQDVKQMDREGQQRLRRETQIVFQHPRTAFDPHFSIFQSLAEPLITHTQLQGEALALRVQQLLAQVGVRPEVVGLYPHDLSNAQLQRVAIARALALKPRFLVLDDPLVELEPLTQVQVLNLLRGLRRKLQLTGLFTSRRVVLAQEFCERLAVLHWGRLVELAPAAALAQDRSRHPYTRALKAAPPPAVRPGPAAPDPWIDEPAPTPMPTGCSYHPRCPLAIPLCSQLQPPLSQVAEGHWVACHRANEDGIWL